MFDVLAATEAILRIEFAARVAARRKDTLSRRYRQIHRERAARVRLEEDILAALKEEGVPASAVSGFRSALKLRHWLAHGKYWHPKLGRAYTFEHVFYISRTLVESIPA